MFFIVDKQKLTILQLSIIFLVFSRIFDGEELLLPKLMFSFSEIYRLLR